MSVRKMAFANSLCGNLSNTCHAQRSSHHSHLALNQKQSSLGILGAPKRKSQRPLMIRSALNKLKSNISNGDNGATEPARVLLERLFAKTQKLEEMMSKDSSLSEENEISLHLEILESDLQAALSALRKKEEDLQDAEGRVLLELAKLNHTKKVLERREREIAASFANQKKMEEDLKNANGDLASQSRQIEDLKLLVEEQSKKIANSQSSLSRKEGEMHKLKHELMKKNEEAEIMVSELESKKQLLNEAKEIINEQEAKLQELQRDVRDKEDDLAEYFQLRRVEEERLKIVEAKLEKQALEWLLAQEELKALAEQASKQMNDVNETSEDFKMVKALLSVVRSELISSQKSLASSRRKMEDQALVLEKQVAELNEQTLLVISYMKKLKDAQLEVETERTTLRTFDAQCEELKSQLSAERELVQHLQEELNRERAYLGQRTQEIALLQNELQQKELEYSDAQNLLQVNESKLVEARLKIQQLKSEQTSVQLILQEKDANLLNAQKKLAEVNNEIAELQKLMNNKEEQLLRATTRLREKEEHILSMQHELDDTNIKFSEAVSVVEQIARLTNKLVISVKDEDSSRIMEQLDEVSLMPDMKQKQLETELEIVKELLREKEMGLLAAQITLVVKDEELKSLLRRLETREKEMEEMKEKLLEDELYSLAQERIRDRSGRDLAIEKLQFKAAKLEAEAATSALKRLSNLTCRLLKETDTSMNFDVEAADGDSGMNLDGKIQGLEEAEKEVSRLLNLTGQLVEEAGINSTTEVQQQGVHATNL